MGYRRYAVYYTPEGRFAQKGAAWLGWDVARGVETAQPDLPGPALSVITETPRRYGFHATLKPPFRLAEGCDAGALAEAVARLASGTAPASCEGLGVAALGSFLAFVPVGDAGGIGRVAAAMVESLDAFRAPAGPDELARRRAGGLSPAQEANLQRWGYPYVMGEFRFHMTLTGRLSASARDAVRAAAEAHFGDVAPAPLHLAEVTLVGEDDEGRFHEIHRYALSG